MVYFISEGMCSALLLIRLNHLSPTSAPVCNINNKIVILLYFCCCITFWLLPPLALEIVNYLLANCLVCHGRIYLLVKTN